jgi:hypothetical protein
LANLFGEFSDDPVSSKNQKIDDSKSSDTMDKDALISLYTQFPSHKSQINQLNGLLHYV